MLLVALVFHVSFWNYPLAASRELCLGLCFGCMRLDCIGISLEKSARFRDKDLLSEERLDKEEILSGLARTERD